MLLPSFIPFCEENVANTARTVSISQVYKYGNMAVALLRALSLYVDRQGRHLNVGYLNVFHERLRNIC